VHGSQAKDAVVPVAVIDEWQSGAERVRKGCQGLGVLWFRDILRGR